MLEVAAKKTAIQQNVQVKRSLMQRYYDFCDAQMKNKTMWYIVPLITLSAVVMPLSIILASYYNWPTIIVGGSMLLFFSNIIASVAAMHTRVVITLYFLTVFLHILMVTVGLAVS